MTNQVDQLIIPKSLCMQEKLGSGRRSDVFRAVYEGLLVVVKVYNQTYTEKYRNQYRVNIAEFEFGRNKCLYEIPALKKFIAKPYGLLNDGEGRAAALIQEYVDGIRLKELIHQLGNLPDEVLQAGYQIVRCAADRGLYDLDISAGNIQVLNNPDGWYPKLYDFNLMPQHLFPPNPFMKLAFLLKLRSKNHRDYRSLKNWKKYGELARFGQMKK